MNSIKLWLNTNDYNYTPYLLITNYSNWRQDPTVLSPLGRNNPLPQETFHDQATHTSTRQPMKTLNFTPGGSCLPPLQRLSYVTRSIVVSKPKPNPRLTERRDKNKPTCGSN